MDFYKGCKTRKQFMNDMTKWFIRENKLGKVKVICEYDNRMDCWGDCTNLGKNRFHIRVHPEQSLQSFAETLAHELVHVRQWVRNKWRGDGEQEAEGAQNAIAIDYLRWKQRERLKNES